jgi:acetyl-CoA C-acetyltransferase
VVSAQDVADAAPMRGVDEAPDGRGAVETYTVMHDRTGEPTDAILACLMPDGRRAWGTVSGDGSALRSMTTEDVIGRTARLTPEGNAHVE